MRAAALALVLLSAPIAVAQPNPPDPHVQAPVRRKHVDPEYPKTLLESGRDVEVVLKLTIDAKGAVEKAEVAVSGGPEFDRAALDAVKQWEFDPATRDERPVHSRIRVPFHFAPPHATHATSTVPSQATEEHHRAPPAPSAEIETVSVFGRSHIPTRGAGDQDIVIGRLDAVARSDATGLLKLAPSIVLQNEGGSGHPYQVFMRGFDAGEAQDIEMSVDGIPINDPGNVHGNGLSDTNFLIPEVIRRVRVIEGSFAPQQGNFGVVGSINFDLGVEQTGLTTKMTVGSFATRRLLLSWRPEGCSERTFAAGEIAASDGFGVNRASQRASAMSGYEGRIGSSMVWRLLVTSYAAQFEQAGVVREDDPSRYWGTYDPAQGGESARHAIGLTLSDKLGAVRLRQSVFGILRDFRLRDNNVGFLLDARGGLVDQQTQSAAVGARGAARIGTTALGEKQEIELGYFARYDAVHGVQERDRSGTTVAYQRDLDLSSGLTNVALYVDSSLKPLDWITARGGVRADLFQSRVTDVIGARTGSNVATAWQPRGTLLVGPFRGFTASASIGQAARTTPPADAGPQLATATSYELGGSYDKVFGATELHARSVFFGTQLDHDLLFDETTNRNTLTTGNARAGWLGSVRATGSFLDVSSSATFVRTIDDLTHAEIPYVPPIVLRMDAALFGDLPWPRIGGRAIKGTLGIGLSYVGKRPLTRVGAGEPSVRAVDYLLLDAGGSLKWRWLELGVSATNLLDQRWRSAEFFYASDFGVGGGTGPVRHFAPGQPLAVFGSLGLTL